MLAKGRLGVGMSVSNTNRVIYQVPENVVTTATISIVNTGNSDVTVTVYISMTENPLAVETIEYNTVITPGGVLERNCVPMSSNEKVIVRASNSNAAIRVSGFEDHPEE